MSRNFLDIQYIFLCVKICISELMAVILSIYGGPTYRHSDLEIARVFNTTISLERKYTKYCRNDCDQYVNNLHIAYQHALSAQQRQYSL